MASQGLNGPYSQPSAAYGVPVSVVLPNDDKLGCRSFLFLSLMSFFTLMCAAWWSVLFVPIVACALCPGVLTLYFLYYARRRQHAKLDQVIAIFASGFFPGALIALVLEKILTYVFAISVFGLNTMEKEWVRIANETAVAKQHNVTYEPSFDETMSIPDGYPHHFKYFFFLFLSAFAVAGGVEEWTKWVLVKGKTMCCCCNYIIRREGIKGPWGMLIYLVAAGLGFSAVENILYALNLASPLIGVFVIAERTVVATPLHGFAAALTAIQMIKSKYVHPLPFWKILLPAVGVHGTYDFISFTLTPSDFGSFLGSLGITVAVDIIVGIYVFRELKQLNLDSIDAELSVDDHVSAAAAAVGVYVPPTTSVIVNVNTEHSSEGDNI